ncbi:MAG TPA: ornithine cyclodeaminase family protein [Microterricola sp.]
MSAAPPFVSADEVFAAVDFGHAVAALDAALLAGLDPAAGSPRSIVDVQNGQLLLMPAEGAGFAGVKLASVAPGNPDRGLERIQAVYLLMDADTLTPLALFDGTAITTLRTPAVSAVAADHLAEPDAAELVVFGSGPQAWGHVQALRAVRPLERVTVVARTASRAEALAARLRGEGLHASTGGASAVASARLIVCATTASEPVFDGSQVRDDACVIAVGSHEPTMRELDSALMARSQVVVEDRATALREPGDIIVPVSEGVLDAAALVPLAELVTGRAQVDRTRPRVFKSVGQGWQDLVVAAEVFRRVGADGAHPAQAPR